MPNLPMHLERTRRGSIVWPVPASTLPGLPETLTVAGRRFERKREFHLTVLGHAQASSIFGSADSAALLARWRAAWRHLEPAVEWLDEVWLLSLPVGADRPARSLATACSAPALAVGRRLLAAWSGVELPEAPAHATLYWAGDPDGIAVPDHAALAERRIASGPWSAFGLSAPH